MLVLLLGSLKLPAGTETLTVPNAEAVITALKGGYVNPVIDITKVGGIDPIITKKVLDANPNWKPEWGG